MERPGLKERLLDGAAFLITAAPTYAFYMLRHYWFRMKGKRVPTRVVEARLSMCYTCPLYDRGQCSRALVSDGERAVPASGVDRAHWTAVDEVHLPSRTVQRLRAAEFDGRTWVRGCGCSVAKKATKWFTLSELAERDGYAPCPLNRWTYLNLANN